MRAVIRSTRVLVAGTAQRIARARGNTLLVSVSALEAGREAAIGGPDVTLAQGWPLGNYATPPITVRAGEELWCIATAAKPVTVCVLTSDGSGTP